MFPGGFTPTADEPKVTSEADPTEAQPVRDLVLHAVKALKSLRLYEGRGEVAERFEAELHQRLEGLLEEHPQLDLAIREFQILWNDVVVYENRDQKESLAFLLFRALDILKPPPAYQLETLGRGVGVMADDIVVGIYALLLLLLAGLLVPSL